jgi:hypothetical protein
MPYFVTAITGRRASKPDLVLRAGTKAGLGFQRESRSQNPIRLIDSPRSPSESTVLIVKVD